MPPDPSYLELQARDAARMILAFEGDARPPEGDIRDTADRLPEHVRALVDRLQKAEDALAVARETTRAAHARIAELEALVTIECRYCRNGAITVSTNGSGEYASLEQEPCPDCDGTTRIPVLRELEHQKARYDRLLDRYHALQPTPPPHHPGRHPHAMNPRYERRHGSIYLVSDPLTPGGEEKLLAVVDRASELAFAFDYENGTLLKHGGRALVETWVKNYLALFPNPTIRTVVFADDAPIEELNKALSTAGYIQRLVGLLPHTELAVTADTPVFTPEA